MKAQLAHLEQTLDDVSKLEEQLEMKAAVENEQRGEIQVLKLRCEGLESQLAAARESWADRTAEYEVLINQLEREVVQAEIKLRKQEQNLRATEMELATKDSRARGASGATAIRDFTSGEDRKDQLTQAREENQKLKRELADAMELATSKQVELAAQAENSKQEMESLRKQGAWDISREVKRARTEMEEQLAAKQELVEEMKEQVVELSAELDARTADLHRLRVANATAEDELANLEGLRTELLALQKQSKLREETAQVCGCLGRAARSWQCILMLLIAHSHRNRPKTVAQCENCTRSAWRSRKSATGRR